MATHRPDPGAADPVGAAEALYRLLTSVLHGAPRNVSLTALSTLATVERSGPLRITDLAAREGVTQPSMTTLVSNLERAGLVGRRRQPEDGRVTLVALTEEGARFLAGRRRTGAAGLATLVAALPPEEAEALSAAVPALARLAALDAERRDAGRGGA